MVKQRLPMRMILHVLRLSADALSNRQIAASLDIGATSASQQAVSGCV
jgi:hypothetical protein